MVIGINLCGRFLTKYKNYTRFECSFQARSLRHVDSGLCMDAPHPHELKRTVIPFFCDFSNQNQRISFQNSLGKSRLMIESYCLKYSENELQVKTEN
jgi:hypothetical protein